MRPYVLKQNILPKWVEEELERVQKFLTRLPESVIPGEHVSCHVVAMVYSEMPKSECPIHWELKHGHFTAGYQHSWLTTEILDCVYPMTDRLILDIYPVAGFQPFIVDGSLSSPWSQLYKTNKAYDFVAKYNDSWKKQAADLRELMEAFND